MLAHQILKAGISIAANAKETQNAESSADFIHNMKIALQRQTQQQIDLFSAAVIEAYPESKPLH